MWDVFISHAWEDKEIIARPLAHALLRMGLKVWYDEFTLKLGDSLRRSIDRGISQSRYGVVILSPYFFAKKWPQRELNGLFIREDSSGKFILPVWHNVTREDIERFSPVLADKLGVPTSKGLDFLVQEILRVVRPEAAPASRPTKERHTFVESTEPYRRDLSFSAESLIDEPDTISHLTSTGMLELISIVRHLVEKEKNLLEVLQGDMLAVGDIYGNFEAVKYIVNLWRNQEYENLVFLGNYVDEGRQQLETINFLLALKLLYPHKVFLLRGNHETPSVNSYYGFSSMCIKTFGKSARRMYSEYNILFSYFSPAFVSRGFLLVHGGMPRGLDTLEELNLLPKGDLDADNEILGQILWNDPSEYYPGFEPNWERGIHYTFGREVFLQFLENHDLTMVIRGNEIFPEGYKYFFDRHLLSVFSSPNYKMGNKAKIAEISKEGKISLIEVKNK